MFLASTGVTAFSSGGTQVMTIPTGTGTNGQVLTTNGSGTASWTTVSSGGGGGLVTSLTTTGTSGAASLSGGGVLNIPNLRRYNIQQRSGSRYNRHYIQRVYRP